MRDDARAEIAKLTDEELTRLSKELGRYASAEMTKKPFWRTGKSGELPGGHEVESIVNEAFTRVYGGQRRWDSQKHPDLKKYLFDVIDSILSHLSTGSENALLRAVPEAGTEQEIQWESGSKERRPEREWLTRAARQPDEALFEREAAEREDRALQLLVEECSTDPVLSKILHVRLEYENPRSAEIAELTGIPVGDIYNGEKRLARKIALVRSRMIESAN